ncbi:glycosyltransferase [Paenibacillus sp. MMS18-CY102]|uniref:glycosyltransferase n=1 Tax=Paenibacillus sp. MMS18-CY102 TaxID=2682849 RepID=UPI0013654829|nr:glycosyltransferase [Paenibacillus sp. MMS18-CY102]MWC28291.1 glycosyltransferase [Paenibacillus sp. MMS18-CY102]
MTPSSNNKRTSYSIGTSHAGMIDVYNEAIQEVRHALAETQQTYEQLVEKSRGLDDELLVLEKTAQELRSANGSLQQQLAQNDLLFAPELDARAAYYRTFISKPLTEHAKRIAELFLNRTYKGIVVYPNAVHWEPVQRPQQILLEFARDGYLCFFCDSGESFAIEEKEPNLFVVTQEEHLLQALQTRHVLVMNTWLIQCAWIDCLPHKTMWYDVLDRVDFLGLYDRNMLAKHEEVLLQADIVTYSARQLRTYVEQRDDAFYLPNACRVEDFRSPVYSENNAVPEDLLPAVRTGHRIIGYFGAIEEWFDKDLIIRITKEQPEIQIVLIGHCNIETSGLPDSVHLLGAKPYRELNRYACYFDALIIPFIINDLTNCVSPVKFFEYCSIGKPIISTAIAEVKPFAGPGVHVVKAGDRQVIPGSFWTLTKEAKQHLAAIAEQNQWESRKTFIENKLISNPEWAVMFANRMYDGAVSVFTATFLDFEGGNYFSGGAERYLVDLHEVCSELGIQLDIYQYGNYSWFRKYKGIDVYSLGHQQLDMSTFTMERLIQFNNRYLHEADGRSGIHFYSAFFQSFPNAAHPSIGISHGVAWDHPSCQFEDGQTFWASNERYISTARSLQQVVSVDTNTANWFQTVSYNEALKMRTIPNYVDPQEFYPARVRNTDKIRIVYPRRLYEPRGLYLTLGVLDSILSTYENTEFHFVGKGNDEDIQRIQEHMDRWPDRVFCYHQEPDRMHEVYKEANIVLIPTLHSEGTSLSCLEACATGNTIISTRVGGLTDIIIDRFNGLLISPDQDELERAIITCLDDPAYAAELGRNALAVSKAFNKTVWKESWKSLILQVMMDNAIYSGPYEAMGTRTVLFHIGMDVDAKKWLPVVHHYLIKGWAVFLQGEHRQQRRASYGRLQWLDKDELLYFEPDAVEKFI